MFLLRWSSRIAARSANTPMCILRMYTGKICNPRTKPFSEQELARQTKFRQAIAAVNELTEEQKTAYATAFKNQSKYGTLRGYMFAQEYAKLGD